MTTPQFIRIFISSPGDVGQERLLAYQVIDNLMHDPLWRERVLLEPIAWDRLDSHAPMLATMTPQEAINERLPKPSECDIVILILWNRMGTPLPPTYKKADGSPYISGTEYEYTDALMAAVKSTARPMRPQILVYWRTEELTISLKDPGYIESHEQWQRVQNFFNAFIAADGSLQGGYNTYAKPDDFRALLEKDLKVIVHQLLDVPAQSSAITPPVPAPLWQGSPFPGLRAFTPDDAPIFFGRGHETDELVALLTDPHCRFLCVVGASGSGKSSLVGAGLLPRLMKNAIEGSKDWIWMHFTPGGVGDNPFMALASELVSAIPLVKRRYGLPRALEKILQSVPLKLDEVLSLALGDLPPWTELLLFIDQFEEVFTVVAERYRQSFVNLLDSIAKIPRVRIVTTLRADFYHRCVEIPQLAALLRSGSYPLAAPDLDVLPEMITRPADYAGLVFEQGLPGRIIKDTGNNPGSLALMAYLLDELYQIYRQGTSSKFTHSAYESLNGVQGAIGTRAQHVFEELDGEAQATFPSVFRELVEVDESGVATRQRATLQQITDGKKDDPSAMLINALAQARLLVLNRGKEDEPVVEVAHEAMLVHWPLLKNWIDTMQEDLILLRQVKQAAKDWERRGKKKAFLWQQERLLLVQTMLRRLNNPSLDEVVREFIRPEQEWLLEEIEDINTSHSRRFSIGQRLAELGDLRQGVGLRPDGLPDIIWLPVGEGQVRLGNQEMFEVKAFYIAKYLVTYSQFQAFIESGGYENDLWWEGLSRPEKLPPQQQTPISNYPRDSVYWEDAIAFCRWLNTHLATASQGIQIGPGWQIRLPTEWEWQQAATGGNPLHIYPWGTEWDERKANTLEARQSQTTAVGMYPQGAAPCGALDMSGNNCEWCLNEYDDIACTDPVSKTQRVRRGGSCNHAKETAQTHYRMDLDSFKGQYQRFPLKHDLGFRIVLAPTL